MARLIPAALLALVGIIFIGQGIGLIGGSPMTSQPFWAVVGVVLLAVAGALVWRSRRGSVV